MESDWGPQAGVSQALAEHREVEDVLQDIAGLSRTGVAGRLPGAR